MLKNEILINQAKLFNHIFNLIFDHVFVKIGFFVQIISFFLWFQRFYRAPELFQKDKQINVTTKCDIYSLGIVMWQMLTRESPYHEEHEDPHVIIYQIVTRKLRPKFPNNSLLNVPKCPSCASFFLFNVLLFINSPERATFMAS